MDSEASAIDVSVSAPLAREERGAILSDSNPGGQLQQEVGLMLPLEDSQRPEIFSQSRW
jgi:hypothetical protein